MAHGHSVVSVDEADVDLDITGYGANDTVVYLWRGEDKSGSARPVDGVRGYRWTDLRVCFDFEA